MRILSLTPLEGVNHWSLRRTLEAVLTDAPEGPVPSASVAALVAALDRLKVPSQLVGSGARLSEALGPEPGWLALVVELSRGWQFLIRGFRGGCTIRPTSEPGTWALALECEEHAIAEACLRDSLEVARSLLAGGPVDLRASHDRLVALADETCYGVATTSVFDAARARGAPIYQVEPGWTVQFGEGVHRKRYAMAITEDASHLAVDVATDKQRARQLWSQVGITVADGRAVWDADDAVAAAEEIGWPVVVKPADSDYGKGVALDLATAEQVREAYGLALERASSGWVLVERFLRGWWHRLLVVGDQMVAALRREPATLVGDGQHTIRELVERANTDPRRGPDRRWPLYFLKLSEIECGHLARLGYTPDSVLAVGQVVALRAIGHTQGGASSRDVTELVHPETVAMARDAALVVGLDVAGLDVIAEDIARPLAEQGGGFLEINAGPSLFLHIEPVSDRNHPVGEAIINALFPPPETGRVPLVVIVGGETAARLAVRLAERLSGRGCAAAVSTPGRTSCGSRPLVADDSSPPSRIRAMMVYPRTEVAVLAVSPGDVLASGLGSDRAHVLVLADVDAAADGGRWSAWYDRMRSVTPHELAWRGPTSDSIDAMASQIISMLP